MNSTAFFHMCPGNVALAFPPFSPHKRPAKHRILGRQRARSPALSLGETARFIDRENHHNGTPPNVMR